MEAVVAALVAGEDAEGMAGVDAAAAGREAVAEGVIRVVLRSQPRALELLGAATLIFRLALLANRISTRADNLGSGSGINALDPPSAIAVSLECRSFERLFR